MDLTATLSKAQGDISQYTERQSKANAEKAEYEAELTSAQQELASEEASRIQLAAEVKQHSGSINVVKKDIQDLELAIQKVETEKAAKSTEDLQVAEDKFSHLTSIKNKLESTLDDIENTVEKDKRSRGNLEKERRKAG